jgi:hypothetical protein
MTINAKNNTYSASISATKELEKNNGNENEFKNTLKQSLQIHSGTQKTAAIFVFALAPWVIDVIAAAGAVSITWLVNNIANIFQDKPTDKNLTPNQTRLLSQVSQALLNNKESKQLTQNQRNGLRATVKKIDDGEGKQRPSAKKDNDNSGGEPPTEDLQPLVKDNTSDVSNPTHPVKTSSRTQADWIDTSLNHEALKALPRGQGVKIFGSRELFERAKAQAHAIEIFKGLYKKVVSLKHFLTQVELTKFETIQRLMTPFLQNLKISTLAKNISPVELSRVVMFLRNICNRITTIK